MINYTVPYCGVTLRISREAYNRMIATAPRPMKYTVKVYVDAVGKWFQYVGSYEFCHKIKTQHPAYANSLLRTIRPYV